MDSVVGIDLSGLWGGQDQPRTVAARIDLAPPLRVSDWLTVRRGPKGDTELVGWVESIGPRVVAIDAPLTLPHSLLCADAACPRCELGSAWYTQRDVDQMARRLGGGMPSVMLAAIQFRGIYLARKLRDLGCEVIETYPAAAYRAMGAIGKSYEERAELLGSRIERLDRTDKDAVGCRLCSRRRGGLRRWSPPRRDHRRGRLDLANPPDHLGGTCIVTGRIPVVRIGRSVRIAKAALIRLIESETR